MTRALAADGARLVAMPNYDPPTRGAVLHHLHAALLPFRAVENRVAFVRADPNGCSQVIDPAGRVLAQSPVYAADTLVADVPMGDGRGTLYTRLGDWLAPVCIIALAALRPRRRAIRPET